MTENFHYTDNENYSNEGYADEPASPAPSAPAAAPPAVQEKDLVNFYEEIDKLFTKRREHKMLQSRRKMLIGLLFILLFILLILIAVRLCKEEKSK